MTVSTVVDHNDYTGNGVTTSFPYTFRIFKKADLSVSVIDLDENITILSLDTDYTITNAGGYNGGYVVLTAPLASGWQISIARELEPTQETDLRNQGKFFPEVHEDAFDKLTMLIQQVRSWFSLSLRKPASIANWYDALNNYIRNVRDPRDPQDVATKNYVDGVANSNLSRTLRTPEPITSLPNAVTRANKIIAFDSVGNPYVTMPPSGSATDVLIELAKPTGPTLIGVQPQGNLSQLIQFVTPEQFGAIGDGTAHPLSERYATLTAAQAVYPFVTSLTQTIDWAACQAAENYARGKTAVRCPFYAKYHLGNNYLKLGEKAKWYGNDSPSLDRDCTMFIREGRSGGFGQDCIVRVATAAEAGSSDEFVRGIVFKGFRLTRNRPRRYNSKYDSTIGFHADHAVGLEVNIGINGCEYGFLGYVCWNVSGTVRIDSCHKSLWLDPATATPEYIPAAGAAMTAVNLRVEVDACVYGPVIRRAKYGKLSGWAEGMIANPTTYPIYDSANETAIALTTYNCDSFDVTEFGIEAWQGVHVYNYGGSVTINESWTPDQALLNTTGKHGPYHAMSVLMGNTELFTLPATDNSMFYNLSVGSLTVRNLSGDLSNTATYGSIYFLTTDQTSRIVFENCAVYFGSNQPRFAPAWLGSVETVGGRYIVDAITPNGYTKVGPNYFVKTSWGLKAINGGDGRVSITVGIDTPANLKLHDVSAYVLTSTTSQPLPIAVMSTSDTAITFQTAVTTTAFSINWKAFVSWSA